MDGKKLGNLPISMVGRDTRTYITEPKSALSSILNCKMKTLRVVRNKKTNKKEHIETWTKYNSMYEADELNEDRLTEWSPNAYQFFTNYTTTSPFKKDGTPIYKELTERFYIIDFDDNVVVDNLPWFIKERGFITLSNSNKIHWFFKCVDDLTPLLGNKIMLFENVSGKMFDDVDLKVMIYEMIDAHIYFPNAEKNLFVPISCIQKLINKTKENITLDYDLIAYQDDYNEVEEIDDVLNPTVWQSLMNLCSEENQTYNGWGKMCYILPAGKIYENLFCKWSNINYRSSETECRTRFQNSEHIASIGALINMAKTYDVSNTLDIISDIKIHGHRKFAVGGGNVRVGKIFYSLCKDKFVYNAGNWYALTPIGRWVKLDSKINGLINAFYDNVNPVIQKVLGDMADLDDKDEKRKAIKKLLVDMTKVNFQKQGVEYASAYFVNEKLKFDDNPYLVGFNNGVWDFTEGVRAFRNYKSHDYMTLSVGYDWVESEATDPVKNQCLNSLVKEILHDDDIIKFFTETLARTLIGINSQKFIILNGTGGNGKGILCDGLGSKMFGDYAYNVPVHLLTDAKKAGANTELAQCSNKRFLYSKEPSAKKRLDNAPVKEMTGGEGISARQCFSNDTVTNLCGTLFMECNPKLNWLEEPSKAEIRRVSLIPFESTYTTDVSEIDIENRIYEQNSLYTTPAWKQEYAPIYFNILKDILLKNSVALDVSIPKKIQDVSNVYLSRGIQLLDFINEAFDIMDADEKKAQKKTGDGVFSLANFMDSFKGSSYYELLSREDKSKSKKDIEELFSTNAFVKVYYTERFRVNDKADSKKMLVDIRKAIVGLKLKVVV